MSNPRKNKVLFNLWLDKNEAESLLISLKDLTEELYCQNIVDILGEAYRRGDFIKK